MPTFKPEEADELAKLLDEKIAKGVQNGLLSAAQRTVAVIQNEIIPAEKPQPVFDGHYRDGWHADVIEGGAQVYNDMPYAGVIERGARAENVKPGRKMIDALAEWARRKGLTGHPVGQRSTPDAYAQARGIAWAIARNMQKVGIFNRDGQAGLGIAKKAAAKIQGFIAEEIRREVKRAMRG